MSFRLSLLSGGGGDGITVNDVGPSNTGLLCTTDTGNDTDHDLNVTAGWCWDTTGTQKIEISSEITKKLDVAWTVGNDEGGLQSGLSITADTTYFVWAIHRSDTDVSDIMFSTSRTYSGLSLPTDYDSGQMIWAVCTDTLANIIPFRQLDNRCEYNGSDLVHGLGSSGANVTDGVFITYDLDYVPGNAIMHCTAWVENDGHTNFLQAIYMRPTGSGQTATNLFTTLIGVRNDNDYIDDLGVQADILLNASQQHDFSSQESQTQPSVEGKLFIGVHGWTLLERFNAT